MNYSVLMSVYYKEKPKFLEQSMRSIKNQTLPTDDFVLVCDGKLTDELNAVVDKMQLLFGECLHVVRLPENCGLGKALNIGMRHCKNDIVARMDSDDIAYPERCEKELEILCKEKADIVSAAVAEFTESVEHIDSLRIPPERQAEIISFAKKRNPFNHPCVMYRKSAVEHAGGYQDFYLLEDYYLWVRMLMDGSKGYNIQQPLLYMRAGDDMYERRAGWRYAKSQICLFDYMRRNGVITYGEFTCSAVLRTASALMPNWVRKQAFYNFMRVKR